MDILSILIIIGTVIGIVVGIIQMLEFLQKRRNPQEHQSTKDTTQPLVQVVEIESIYRTHLRQLFTTLFNESELRTLCFDLGIDYESFAGDDKDSKVRELLAYMQRHGLLSELIAAGKKLRPHAQWNEATTDPQLNPSEILHNLPRRQKFVGREEEKAAILEALKSRDYLVSVEGIGGIGKSALTLEVAHTCLEASTTSDPDKVTVTFDGFVWASAKDQELTLNKLVDTIARTLNYPGIAQLPLEDKQLELRRLLQSKSYLIVVDNFETIRDEAIRTFLRDLPTPSQGLITTREQKLRNARVIALQELPQADALALMFEEGNRLGLKALKTATEQTLLPLYNATGGAPLAIKWATGQIKQQGQSLDTVIDALQNAEGPIFETIFSRSWDLLSESTRTILMTLPLFSAPADQADIAAASGIHNSQLVQGIGQLVEMSLVNVTDELDLTQRRYDVHPLCRSFARAQLTNNLPLEEEARLRLANHYLERSCREGGEWGNISGFPWFQAELPNLLAVLEWAYQEGKWSLVTKMFQCLYFFLGTRGYWEERVTYGQMVLKAAEQANDPEAIADVQHSIGWILFRQDKHQEADEILQKGVQLYLSLGDNASAALLLTTRARIAVAQGNINQAKAIINEAMQMLRKDGHTGITASILAAKGKLALREKEYEKAEKFLLEALALLQKSGREIRYSSRQIELGNVALAQKKHEKAKVYFATALESAQKVQRQENIAKAEFGLARVYFEQGKLAEAKQMAVSSRDQFMRMLMRHEVNKVNQLLEDLVMDRQDKIN